MEGVEDHEKDAITKSTYFILMLASQLMSRSEIASNRAVTVAS
jgi:hypothetical protein